MIEFTEVSLTYPNGVRALEDINVFIDDGEFVFLMGSTGSGKSSLMKLIYREELPTSGEVYVNNVDVTELRRSQIPYLRRKIGVVFQDYKLLDYKTAAENVAYALEVTDCPANKIPEKVQSALLVVGLLEKKDRLPEELSGGERQLTSIARALVHNPPILLADEPTGNLDSESSGNIINVLNFINSKGTTIIVATHDTNLAGKLPKRIITLKNGRISSDEGVSIQMPDAPESED